MGRYLSVTGKVAGIAWVALIGGATGAIILYVAYALLAPSADPWQAQDCDRGTEIQAASSPDGSLVARGIFLLCGGPMANTAANYVVIVKPGQEPTRASEVFTGDWGQGNAAGLIWKGDKLLQITLPDDALIYQHRQSFDGVTVDVRFVSNDPAVRETALSERQARMK